VVSFEGVSELESDPTPFEQGFVMPAEWAEHERTWMAFPPAAYSDATSLADARSAWADVARAVSEFEPVTMMTRGEDRADAEALLAESVEWMRMQIDDAWARDTMPAFVRSSDGTLLAVDWTFNGWGKQEWATWGHDDAVAENVALKLRIERFRTPLVNEGGAIEVDGTGRLLATRTVQLDPDRNPGLSESDVEGIFQQTLGTDNVTWFDRGLAGDYLEFSTRGHVDLLAKFIAPGVAVFHDQRNSDHPDFATSRAIEATLTSAGIDAVALVAPERAEIDGRICDWSYVNSYFVNGGMIVGTFDDPADDAALATLRNVVPGRTVTGVDARTLFRLGGGVHCVTMQQPK
jgi:agmatine deiminase